MKCIAKSVVTILFVVVAVSAAHAQTQKLSWLMPTAWGNAEVWKWVDADGNPATQEAIVRNWDDYKFKVVRLQANGVVCEGGWFWWGNDMYAFPELKRVAGKDSVFSTHWLGDGYYIYVEYGIDVPAHCQP